MTAALFLPPSSRVGKGRTIDARTSGLKKSFSVYVYRFDPSANEGNKGKSLPDALKENFGSDAKKKAGHSEANGPRLDHYLIDQDKAGSMALDTLMYLKGYVDTTLTFRRSCREGVCGSCAMNINGVNRLACIYSVQNLSALTFYPLPHQPVIKDLVPDLRHALAQYAAIQPWQKPEKPLLDGAGKASQNNTPAETRQSPAQREKLEGLWECVLCFCCSAGCPSYWWNSDQYLGPATLLQAARFVQDSRDKTSEKRLKHLEGEFSLYRCHSILNCAQTCPKGLNPAKAIQGLKNACQKKALHRKKTQ